MGNIRMTPLRRRDSLIHVTRSTSHAKNQGVWASVSVIGGTLRTIERTFGRESLKPEIDVRNTLPCHLVMVLSILGRFAVNFLWIFLYPFLPTRVNNTPLTALAEPSST